MTSNNYDVIVIGSGVTGLSACIELLKQGVRVANIEAQMFGGLVININELDGTVEGSGTDYASELMMLANQAGAVTLSETVMSIAEQPNGTLVVTTDQGAHQTKAIIVATGATLKKLEIPGEAQFEYKGVSNCADCDGPMYQDAQVVVVGGGDSALQEALVLTEFCKTVHLVHNQEHLRAKPHLTARANDCEKILQYPLAQLTAILGVNGVEAVEVKRISDQSRFQIPCTGVFAYIGLKPTSDFLPKIIERDNEGRVITSRDFSTAMNNVFAAGAVRHGYQGMLEHAIAEAHAAAQYALLKVRASE